MAANMTLNNSIRRCSLAAVCSPALVLPIIDAAVLVVSVVVCLRVIMPLA